MHLHPALSLFLFIWLGATQSYVPPPEVKPVRLSLGHPRLSFRPAADRGLGRSFDDVRRLYGTDPAFRRIFDHALAAASSTRDPAMAAAAWVVSGDDVYARTAAVALVAAVL